ncbi:MAG: hypothetical protein HPY83_16690 [Anaerolineae bacterium]|nr:hypothetical protein [Anaerolineae bacterium]
MVASGPVELNTATFDQLCSVPGVGPALARKVIEFRQRRGRLADLNELLQVEGITPGLLDRLRPHLTVAPLSPTLPCDAAPASLEPASEPEPPGPAQEDLSMDQDTEEPATSVPELHPSATPPETTGQDSRRAELEERARREEAQPVPEAEPLAPPRIEPLFDDEEEWPRSYGGVSSAILFGEADPTAEGSGAPPQSRSSATYLGLGRLLLLVLLSGILGAVLSLASLLTLNNTLYYVSRDQLERDFTGRLDALEGEAEALSARLELTAARLGNVEVQIQEVSGALHDLDSDLADLGVRVAEVEGLRDQVEETMSQVQALTEDIGALRTDLDQVSATADRFGAFLDALRGALDQTAR